MLKVAWLFLVCCCVNCFAEGKPEQLLYWEDGDKIRHYAVSREKEDHPPYFMKALEAVNFSVLVDGLDNRHFVRHENCGVVVIDHPDAGETGGQSEYRDSAPKERGIYSVRFHPGNDERIPSIRQWVVVFRDSNGIMSALHAGNHRIYPIDRSYHAWGKLWVKLNDNEARVMGLDLNSHKVKAFEQIGNQTN